jgi:electron-transferring-flavoprotein dehydrogenase
MGISGITGGRINLGSEPKRTSERMPSFEQYYQGKLSSAEIEALKTEAEAKGESLHDRFMDKVGWPAVEFDNELLISHQDALLKGGKVQAAGGYADHVAFVYPNLCESCGTQICVELCSGQAISKSEGGGVPDFDREKCVHCGACLWSCARAHEEDPERGNIEFRAGAGGLHSAEN